MRNSPKRKVLVLAPFPPRLDGVHGGSRAIAHLLMSLSERHEIALAHLRSTEERPVDDVLKQRCALIEEVVYAATGSATHSRWLRRARLLGSLINGKPMWVSDTSVTAYARRVRTIGETWHPDVIQIEFQAMGQYLPALEPYKAPRILRVHEPGTAAAHDMRDHQRGVKRLMYSLDALAWQRFERTVIGRVHVVVVLSERDRQALEALNVGTPIVHIPLATPIPAQPLSPAGRSPQRVLFVGNYTHPPNRDAAIRLALAIFPDIRLRHPGVTLQLIGDKPTEEMLRYATDDIEVTGAVDDLHSIPR